MHYRPIDDSLLNRVRTTLSTTQREPRRFRREAPVVVPVVGEVDFATAPTLSADVRAAFASGAPVLRIDLSETTFIDSSGVHVLVDAACRAEALGRELTIVCPRSNIRRIIEIAAVGALLPLIDTGVA